jgi:ribosomal protein L11 methyltransferase
MFELRINVDGRLVDALSGCLFEAGAGGVAEQDDDAGTWVVVYCAEQGEGEELARVAEAFRERALAALPDAEMGPVLLRPLDPSWQDTWLGALRPAPLTGALVLRPTHADSPPDGEETLWFEPAAAFGSGDHPTTRLAARAVERACATYASAGSNEPLTVLDVGSGSGVLCFVAARRGARRAVGVDIDPTAVAAAARNATLNDLANVCTFSAQSLAELAEPFPLVVANIDAPTLTELAAQLRRVLAPGGTLLLTGLLDEQETDVRSVFEAQGLRNVGREQEGEWVLLAFSAPRP